ncbi:MAG TPA: ZIP family metal transporter [Candidatus Nanoarchaeia archaeon]|nr:ZIP family metal transporter [Candidatus Nanoarchaeia archaeon]
MLEIWIYALASVFIISLISLVGIFTLSVERAALSKVLIYLVGISAGTLFGGAFLHLLPELIEEHGFGLNISYLILSGIILFFVLEKIVHWHHHHTASKVDRVHPFSIMILVGDGMHNLLDGLIIGATYLISIPAGIATTLVVALHEIPQEISDFGVLLHGGFSVSRALIFNFLSSLAAVVGVIVALVLGGYVAGVQFIIASIAIGGFIYIAGSDLIPELQKHPSLKSSLLQLLTFIIGIVIMAALLLLE